jgi:MazG nucleotide pyrophosphohydrolase domain
MIVEEGKRYVTRHGCISSEVIKSDDADGDSHPFLSMVNGICWHHTATGFIFSEKWNSDFDFVKEYRENDMKYIDMVRNLSKPVEDIHAKLTPFKCGLIHSAMGISGEVAELIQAIEADDIENIKEELGDLYFYVRQAFMYLDCQLCNSVELGTGSVKGLIARSGDFADLVKKHCIYNKPIDIQAMAVNLTALDDAIFRISEAHGFSVDEVYEQNKAKLLNGRYKSGSYSDAQAIERADKNV